MNTSISPSAPNSLKLTQALVEKLYATHRLIRPMTAKNATQAKFSRCQTLAGSSICSPISMRRMFLPNSSGLSQNASPIAQYSTLGFHLMKVSLWK